MSRLDIACDEAGHTGPDLLHKDQRYFAYASVAVTDAEASTDRATRRFGFDLDQARLSGSVVPIAASTGNGRRPARVLASRRIVDCGLHALAGSAIR
jgi:hypothetical protein